jgi:pyruvate-ferredoxin/flavodoxin oxidoreductase
MDKFAGITGRRYNLFDYFGDPNAERVMILMGSGAETACETADYLNAARRKGRRDPNPPVPTAVRQPFPGGAAGQRQIHRRLERTKEPGATGEPMYLEVVNTLMEAHRLLEPCRCQPCPGSLAVAMGCRPRNSPRRCAKRCSMN